MGAAFAWRLLVIAAAFLAVPIIATANAMIHAAANHHSGTVVRDPPAGNGKATP